MFGIFVVCTVTLFLSLEKIIELPCFSHFLMVTDGGLEDCLWSTEEHQGLW